MASSFTQVILDKLRVVPFSVEGLAVELKADVGLIAVALTSLLRAGQVGELRGRQVEGGPFYCLPGYAEETVTAERPELARSYARFYEAPDWRTDV